MRNAISYVSIGFALAAFAVGVRAAALWYRASLTRAEPPWQKDLVVERPFEPVDDRISQMGWTSAILTAMEEAAALNARAARWSAWAVGLSALSAIVSVMSGLLGL